MDIRLVEHKDLDKAAWDNCIGQSVNGNIYAFSWYLDIVCDEWDALISGEYESVFPLTFRKKFGIWYLYQPFFTQQLGIFSILHITPQIVEEFLSAIPKRYKFAEINLNAYNKPDRIKWQLVDNLNHELDLIEPYEILKKGYSQNTSRNIAKAIRNNISISSSIKPEEIVRLFRDNKGKQFRNLTENDYRRFIRLAYECIVNRKAICYGAYTSENTLCAGAIVVFSHRKAIFLFSATNETAKEKGAMFMLIDHFIQDLSGNHLTLDFEGSNDPSLARFYKSFGSVCVSYPGLRFNRLSLHFKMLNRVYKIVRNINFTLPMVKERP
ncbi:MAG: hypothetical protein FD166_3486 [Bacteroidetes bacterium]|jgi:hypothetical protein|nr:MAG: hypothetical protein FD166_3486 [Bacteroidota bacterium]